MNDLPESTCPKCGSPIPADAPHQLCPKCVLVGVSTTPVTDSRRSKTQPPSVAEVAAQFSDLEIIELIGVGGMGAVYKARQLKLDRFVALKILSRDLAEDSAFKERFNREARVLARLNHPNIVTVFDFGISGPFYFLLMQYIEGVNLRQAMQTEKFTPAESLELVQDVCSALKYAHEEGVLHRDIKPENILIDQRGRVKIADFGIAKMIGVDGSDDYTLTMPGHALGSPHYMAPEQIETPGDVDQRADIYSLGVVFYELLTRELPIGRFSPPSQRSPMDPRIDEIVMRALEKDRQARYQNAQEVKTGVASIASPPQPAQQTYHQIPQPPFPPPVYYHASSTYSFVPHPIPMTAAVVFTILSVITAIFADLLRLGAGAGSDDALVGSLIALPFVILSTVFNSILLYRCWRALPEQFRATSPGKAVGFLFIPFFNFYWVFISWPSLAKGLIEWQHSLGIRNMRSSYGLAMTYSIIWVLGWIIGWIPGLASLLTIGFLVIYLLMYGSIVSTINRIRQNSV